jgi:lysyl-tRNA synthetase class 2
MEDTNSLIEQRKAKLQQLEASGVFPFKNKFNPSESCAVARGNYVEGREVAVAGRITAHRDMGKSMFIDVRDQSGRIQAYAQKNVLGEEQFGIFNHLDLGDFIGVKGHLFTTKTGEISIKVSSFTILAKALRPLPGKWHGLEDTEIRYRQRYLDLISNPAVMDVMLQRSAIVHEIRQFFHGRGYVEVETPVMQGIPGGAAAQPFKTFHNALGCEFYLRIALELYHKRLLVGGIDKLFEIGKNFRNEGLSRRHNPEFTMLEAYCAYGDYEVMMKLVEDLITFVAKQVFPDRNMRFPRSRFGELYVECQNIYKKSTDLTASLSLIGSGTEAPEVAARIREFKGLFDKAAGSFPFHWELAKAALPLARSLQDVINQHIQANKEKVGENEAKDFNELSNSIKKIESLCVEEWIDLTPNWRRAKYKELVREKVTEKTAGKVSDWFALTSEERRRVAIEDLQMAGDIAKGYEDFEVTGAVFEKLIEPTLIQPTFVTHLPKELVPLAKLTPDDPTTVEVFECCINGQEISPGYTEQNDPVAQRATLEHQAGGETQKLDEDFLVALEHGMPPAGGIGIGIDRLCMMLLGQESIRDVILFPQLKPK